MEHVEARGEPRFVQERGPARASRTQTPSCCASGDGLGPSSASDDAVTQGDRQTLGTRRPSARWTSRRAAWVELVVGQTERPQVVGPAVEEMARRLLRRAQSLLRVEWLRRAEERQVAAQVDLGGRRRSSSLGPCPRRLSRTLATGRAGLALISDGGPHPRRQQAVRRAAAAASSRATAAIVGVAINRRQHERPHQRAHVIARLHEDVRQVIEQRLIVGAHRPAQERAGHALDGAAGELRLRHQRLCGAGRTGRGVLDRRIGATQQSCAFIGKCRIIEKFAKTWNFAFIVYFATRIVQRKLANPADRSTDRPLDARKIGGTKVRASDGARRSPAASSSSARSTQQHTAHCPHGEVAVIKTRVRQREHAPPARAV